MADLPAMTEREFVATSLPEFYIEVNYTRSVAYAEFLMRQNREEVGFLPTSALETLAQKGGLVVGVLNADPCGYIAFQPPTWRRETRWLQICVPTDARLHQYGAAIVEYVENIALANGSPGIWFKVAWDIEANEFWQALGYYCTGYVHGGWKRNRLLNVFRKDFRQPLMRIEAPPLRGAKDLRRYNAMRRSGKLLLPFGYQQQEIIEWT